MKLLIYYDNLTNIYSHVPRKHSENVKECDIYIFLLFIAMECHSDHFMHKELVILHSN
jgi:hypothetical protein